MAQSWSSCGSGRTPQHTSRDGGGLLCAAMLRPAVTLPRVRFPRFPLMGERLAPVFWMNPRFWMRCVSIREACENATRGVLWWQVGGRRGGCPAGVSPREPAWDEMQTRARRPPSVREHLFRERLVRRRGHWCRGGAPGASQPCMTLDTAFSFVTSVMQRGEAATGVRSSRPHSPSAAASCRAARGQAASAHLVVHQVGVVYQSVVESESLSR